jgi:hypothetical protein
MLRGRDAWAVRRAAICGPLGRRRRTRKRLEISLPAALNLPPPSNGCFGLFACIALSLVLWISATAPRPKPRGFLLFGIAHRTVHDVVPVGRSRRVATNTARRGDTQFSALLENIFGGRRHGQASVEDIVTLVNAAHDKLGLLARSKREFQRKRLLLREGLA